MVKKITGWQFTVYFFDDHVIKIKHDYDKARKRIAGYLHIKGKSEEYIDKETMQTLANVDNSWNIIARSNCPLELLANIKQLNETTFKQDLAISLPTRIKLLLKKQEFESIEKILDEFIETNLRLWQYGIYESTYKLDGYGYIGSRMVLIDPFELNDNLDYIHEQIKSQDWRRICYRYRYPTRLEDYIERQHLSSANFEKNWKQKIIKI